MPLALFSGNGDNYKGWLRAGKNPAAGAVVSAWSTPGKTCFKF
jgi:hypothetical protein